MATLKHLSSKNADYGVAEQYLTFEHDEFTGKPILDENGRLVPRQDYRISSLNCGEEDFAVACMRANLRYGKNQQREDVKSHHYILSFDPRDGPDHGLTMDKAQALGERFCAEQFPGHQALVCTHPDGHNHSGNIHVHIVINSLRVAEVERKPYMDRASDTQAGAKHRCTAAAMRHFRAEVMELCQGAGLYQIDLLGGSKNRVTEREYWAQKKGQLALDTEAAAQGKPPTKFETDKEKLRREIRAVLNLAVSFEDFAQRLLQRGITVKESRGRLSYLTPDRAKPITARKLGDDFDRAAVGAALERNAARPSLGAKPSIREQLRQPQGVQRMVDIEAKKAEGKGIGYQQWASVFNLKQIANSVNVYTEYGFSSPEELDAAVSAAFAAVRDSAASLKPKELALKEKKELRRQIIIYRNTKAVRDGLAAQKTPKARAAYRQEHEGDLLLSEATIRFFKANGIALPLEPQGTTTEADRYEKGYAIQYPLYGDEIARKMENVPDSMGHDVARFLTEYAFGDIYTRGGLSVETRELLIYCILTTIGADAQLQSHAQGNLRLGTAPATLAAAVIQCLPYVGFPPAMKALQAIADATAEPEKQLVRLSRIVVDPSRLEAYNTFLKEEIETSMRVEPGVLTLYATAEKERPHVITILEVYADEAAYQSHIQTPHFLKYKHGTLDMVQSLELVDSTPLIPGMKIK